MSYIKSLCHYLRLEGRIEAKGFSRQEFRMPTLFHGPKVMCRKTFVVQEFQHQDNVLQGCISSHKTCATVLKNDGSKIFGVFAMCGFPITQPLRSQKRPRDHQEVAKRRMPTMNHHINQSSKWILTCPVQVSIPLSPLIMLLEITSSAEFWFTSLSVTMDVISFKYTFYLIVSPNGTYSSLSRRIQMFDRIPNKVDHLA